MDFTCVLAHLLLSVVLCCFLIQWHINKASFCGDVLIFIAYSFNVLRYSMMYAYVVVMMLCPTLPLGGDGQGG